jgi:hypothetical protein
MGLLFLLSYLVIEKRWNDGYNNACLANFFSSTGSVHQGKGGKLAVPNINLSLFKPPIHQSARRIYFSVLFHYIQLFSMTLVFNLVAIGAKRRK